MRQTISRCNIHWQIISDFPWILECREGELEVCDLRHISNHRTTYQQRFACVCEWGKVGGHFLLIKRMHLWPWLHTTLKIEMEGRDEESKTSDQSATTNTLAGLIQHINESSHQLNYRWAGGKEEGSIGFLVVSKLDEHNSVNLCLYNEGSNSSEWLQHGVGVATDRNMEWFERNLV